MDEIRTYKDFLRYTSSKEKLRRFSRSVEITDALEVPIIIYLPTDYIDEASLMENEANRKEDEDGRKVGGSGLPNLSHPENPKKLRHMDWEMCRDMLGHGITFG